jgi:hypothetical protein
MGVHLFVESSEDNVSVILRCMQAALLMCNKHFLSRLLISVCLFIITLHFEIWWRWGGIDSYVDLHYYCLSLHGYRIRTGRLRWQVWSRTSKTDKRVRRLALVKCLDDVQVHWSVKINAPSVVHIDKQFKCYVIRSDVDKSSLANSLSTSPANKHRPLRTRNPAL